MDWKLLDTIAQRAALAAAKIQRHYFTNGVDVTYKGEVDLLTQADLESQETILHVLQDAFPDHLYVAEENKLGHGQSFTEPTWIIDPLDGTTNFAHRYPYFGISIAFVQNNVTQYALIHQPLLNETFTAIKGQGAFLNDQAIHVSKTQNLKQALLSTGFPYDKRTNAHNNLALFSTFELSSLCVRRGGAAAIDLAYVACGRIDGFWEGKLKPWDIAAGILLIKEAGGQITDYAGASLNDLRSLELVASNGLIHQSIIEQTARHRISI